MPIPHIRAVLFDAVGTLIHPHPPVAQAYAQLGREFGSALGDEEIDARFRGAWAAEEARDAELDYRTGEKREQERWRNIVESLFDDVEDKPGLFAALWDHFAAAENWGVFPDVAPAWERLRACDLQLGIASNFDLRLHVLCKRLPPLDGASRVIVSSLLGRRKPHPEFFAKAAAMMKLPPEQILFVGDSLELDYRPALSAGMSAVLLERGPDRPPSPEVGVSSLAGIADLLGASH